MTEERNAHQVTWFSPDRPVENGTVFVRPEPGKQNNEVDADD